MVEFLSLDGVVQAPPLMSKHRRYMTEVLGSVGALLRGRATYEIVAFSWPRVVDPDDEITRVFNRVPKYVVSTRGVAAALFAVTKLSARIGIDEPPESGG